MHLLVVQLQTTGLLLAMQQVERPEFKTAFTQRLPMLPCQALQVLLLLIQLTLPFVFLKPWMVLKLLFSRITA